MRRMDWRTFSSRIAERLQREGRAQAGVGLYRVLHVVVAEGQHPAVGALIDDDLGCAQQTLRDHQRTDRIVADDAARISADVSVALVEAEQLVGVEARVRALDHVHAARAGGDGRASLSKLSAQRALFGSSSSVTDMGATSRDHAMGSEAPSHQERLGRRSHVPAAGTVGQIRRPTGCTGGDRSRSAVMFRQKGNQQLADLRRFVFHREMAAITQDMQLGVWNRIVQLARPRNHLPPIVLAPDDLNRHLAELEQAVRDFFRVPVVVVANLMLKETGLADGAGDEVEIRVESRFAQTPLVVHRREKPFSKVLSMLAIRLSDEQLEAFLHLLRGYGLDGQLSKLTTSINVRDRTREGENTQKRCATAPPMS